MEASQIYILISIIILLIIFILMNFIIKKNKKQKPLTPLAGLAFVFIIMSIILGESRLASYSLIVIGVLLAIIDMIIKLKKK